MTALSTHDIPAAAAWSVLVRRGRLVRMTALSAGANCSTLVFAAHDPVDRLNVPDTLKAQMSACIRAPMVLMSDRGTALASVTGSSVDWHDCLCGHSVDLSGHGPSSYATDRNDWRRPARDGLLAELRKHGRGPADLHACVNFFSKVATSDDAAGRLALVAGHATVGDWVTLRAEQDLLLVLATSPHPLDPAWTRAGVRVEIEEAAVYGADDPSMTFRAESARAIEAARAVLA